MNVSIKQLLDYYTEAPIRFKDMFQNTIQPNFIDQGRRTNAYSCGIVIPISGEGIFQLNGEDFHLNANTFLHAGPSETIRINAKGSEPFTYAVLHYQVVNLEKYPLTRNHFEFLLNESFRLLELVESLFKQFEYPGDFSKLRCQTIFIHFIEQLLFDLREGKGKENHLIEQIIHYIHKNYREGLSVLDIQKKYEINARRLPAIFQKYTGLTPIQYIIELRMQDAKTLLRNSTMSIQEIAIKVGYEDAFYFSRIFKKYNGVSPKEFRKEFAGNLLEKSPLI